MSLFVASTGPSAHRKEVRLIESEELETLGKAFDLDENLAAGGGEGQVRQFVSKGRTLIACKKKKPSWASIAISPQALH